MFKLKIQWHIESEMSSIYINFYLWIPYAYRIQINAYWITINNIMFLHIFEKLHGKRLSAVTTALIKTIYNLDCEKNNFRYMW